MIEKNIIDYEENKKDIQKWLNLKGEQKYLEFSNLLLKSNIECNWKNLDNLYRYDKRLLINLFKYMCPFEEYIRALLWRTKSYSYNKLKVNLRKLISYLTNDILQINESEKKQILKLRNTISHNNIVIQMECDGHKYKDLIKNFYKFLPEVYKKGFEKDIKDCEKGLNINKKFLV